MSYVTQGTVQIEIKAGADSAIRINPVQDYSVKRNGKTFTVFTSHDPKTPGIKATALIFDAAEVFTIRDPEFLQPLIEASAKGTKIEIVIQDSSGSIESLRIPATL